MTEIEFKNVLGELRKASRGKSTTKGRLFERLVKSFLLTSNIYKSKFSDVYMWNDYPDRDGRGDFGIDLVAVTHKGKKCAIQCKFFSDKRLEKSDIDSFLEAGSRSEFDTMMLVYVAKGYGRNAEDALNGHGCELLSFESLSQSNVEWPDLAAGHVAVKRKKPFELMEHQNEAVTKVVSGLEKADRGQMIMACGTGKTITALHIAEKMYGDGGLILYVVPSISLMQQTIRTWSEQRRIPHMYIGVCSDPKVSHNEKSDIPLMEMRAEVGVTTDPARIAKSLKRNGDSMTVVFSTYQSMGAIVNAQKIRNAEKFDLVICDEAHRTTGVEESDEKSPFLLVHNDVNATRRLYMTATQRVYTASAKSKAKGMDMEVYSMDENSSRFGNVLYRLGFSKAIDGGLLSDYKVLVLSVSEKYAAKMLPRILESADDAGDLNITDAASMLGIHSALQYPDKEIDAANIQTAIIYTNRVRDSKKFAKSFKNLDIDEKDLFMCKAKHVDGSQNASVRADALQWLRESSSNQDECRILTNARCLSEGVDVPTLDSICFTNPKSSQVDIIQAVGRVMRTAKNKKYGYVIVPVAIPESTDAVNVLDNKKAFGTIWSVLRALRSHDERMDIEVNTADVRKKLPSRIKFIGIGTDGTRRESETPDAIPLADLDIPADAICSRIVDRVGDRQYFEHWARDVADIVPRITERMKMVISGKPAGKKFRDFMTGLREIIHDNLTDEEGLEMLTQHMITRRIFEALFGSDEFGKNNPISTAMNDVISTLRENGLETELRDLEKFYTSIEKRISNLKTHDARQKVISELYGTFFKTAFPKMTERLGIVYTPVEIVDFILKSVNHVLQTEFNQSIADSSVNVIDPFTGTGTFITRLLSEDMKLLQKKDVIRKYKSELYANETVLLAYYIAAANCESIYGQRTGKFESFTGLSLTDTFTNATIDEYTGDIFQEAKKRIRRQRKERITVIVGNPPYSAGQSNFNDQNQNVSYPEIDKRIESTYLKETKSINPKIGRVASLYDSYIRSLRWASDRIGKSGVIGFVTNASFIRSEAAAGLRACLQDEFTDVWVFDLRGNARTQGEERKKEAGNAFGGGSRAPVAITILVKNPDKKSHAIHYYDIGNYHSREKKLDIISTAGSIAGIKPWQEIKPDRHHDWLDQRTGNFTEYLPMGSKDAKAGKGSAIFRLYSGGVATSRDPWVYNSSERELSKNMKTHIDYCNSQDLDNPIIKHKQAKWDGTLSQKLKRLGKQKFSANKILTALYRPFFRQSMYFDHTLNISQYLIPKFFPKPDSENLAIITPYKIARDFSTFVTDITPDLELVHHGQCFPLYTYENNKKQENITNHTLEEYQNHYNDKKITKEDIFYYTYGVLHHPIYRKKYANNLTRELPHIPMAPDFWTFSNIGKQLADLHLSWETCPRYDLGPPKAPFGKYQKMAFARKKNSTTGRQVNDPTKLKINGIEVFDNIPETNYRINGRTPLEWAIDRYKISTDKDSGIVNDATNVDIIPLIERLVYVGVESDRLISELPKEFEPKSWKPKKSGLDGFLDVTAQTKLA